MLLSVVIGDGPHAGQWVIDRADYVMFTGSTRVGREVAARCGERLIGCSLELGGKNALVVRADADIDRSAEIAERACFANSGQLCIGTERVLVHESVVEEFLAAFLARVNALRLKAGVGWGADMGSLVSASVSSTPSRPTSTTRWRRVPRCSPAAARVRTSGRSTSSPPCCAASRPDMLACRDETFGPVVSRLHLPHGRRGVAMANDSEYGLNAAVLTRDTRAGQGDGAAHRGGHGQRQRGVRRRPGARPAHRWAA